MEHCAQHRRREPQPQRQKTERCALLRGHGRNRTAKGERDLNELPNYIQAVSLSLSGRTCDASHIPRPCGCSDSHERATAGGRYGLCDTAGSRTPQRGKTSQKLATLRAVSACVVTTWRGKSIHKLFNEKKSRRVGSRTPQHSRESQPLSPFCTASHDGCRKHYYQSSMR